MRLSTDAARDEPRALDTIVAAVDAGLTVFDTAHAYGLGAPDLGHNERLLAHAIRLSGAAKSARIVTKGGMTRAGGGWIPDGRANAMLTGCEASLAALDGLAIDLFLIHAPDQRTPWETSVRALRRLLDEGLVRHVGLSNVNRPQLDAALDIVPVTAVEIELSVLNDSAIRAGVVDYCADKGIAVIAHSPLGGPRRAASLGRKAALADVATLHAATHAEVALAWLLTLSPNVIAIPGARRPETARSAARAASLRLDDSDRALLDRAFGNRRLSSPIDATTRRHGSEVVVVMGIPGAGKSSVANDFIDRGYVRLNRDQRGGSLRELSEALDQALASDAEHVILDNTYLTRSTRSRVIESAHSHGVPVRCIWLDTSLAQAQVNLVERLLDRFGSLPSPEELAKYAKGEPGLLAPASQMRAYRELEPPSDDEGFTEIEHVAFTRAPSRQALSGVFVAAAALRQPDWHHAMTDVDPSAPYLVFDWSADGSIPDDLDACIARLGTRVSGSIESAVCTHGGGPPRCWCRPPLPGLPLAFARAHGIDTAKSTVIGTAPAHATLARALGATYRST
jgi:aryl-alcohol dehydrogenase-like predicted oxidoreductase